MKVRKRYYDKLRLQEMTENGAKQVGGSISFVE